MAVAFVVDTLTNAELAAFEQSLAILIPPWVFKHSLAIPMGFQIRRRCSGTAEYSNGLNNTATSVLALTANTTGDLNTAAPSAALLSNSTGNNIGTQPGGS